MTGVLRKAWTRARLGIYTVTETNKKTKAQLQRMEEAAGDDDDRWWSGRDGCVESGRSHHSEGGGGQPGKRTGSRRRQALWCIASAGLASMRSG